MKLQSDFVLEKYANSFRTENGFDSHEPIRLKSLLQKLNVVTLFIPLSKEFSGMALKVENRGSIERFILVNSTQSLGKQHFTICHELYHLFIQAGFSSRFCKTGVYDKKDPEEYSADIFASYLLLPKDGILKHIPDEELNIKRLGLPTILHLENLYSCSRSALLYSLKKINLINSTQYDDWCKNVKRSALEHGYQISLYEAGNHNIVIGDYGVIAKELFNKEKISESHYYSLLADLGIDLSKIDDTVDGE